MTRGTRIAVVIVIVALVAFLLEFGRRSEVLSEVFTGLGLPRALVIAAVVILAALGGWYFWKSSPRGQGIQPKDSDQA